MHFDHYTNDGGYEIFNFTLPTGELVYCSKPPYGVRHWRCLIYSNDGPFCAPGHARALWQAISRALTNRQNIITKHGRF